MCEREPWFPSPGVGLIAAERERQISAEGWTPEHDDIHVDGALAHAAAVYASDRVDISDVWPWPDELPKVKDDLRNLVRAGALIAAEIDRLSRAAHSHPHTKGEA